MPTGNTDVTGPGVETTTGIPGAEATTGNPGKWIKRCLIVYIDMSFLWLEIAADTDLFP